LARVLDVVIELAQVLSVMVMAALFEVETQVVVMVAESKVPVA
jgi:hypothetical protein